MTRSLAAVAGLVVLLDVACEAAADVTPPSWMVSFEATPNQPIGIEEADLRKWIEKTHNGEFPKAKKAIWDRVFQELMLLQTPSAKRDVPAFSLARYEVTNAQWAKFLEYRTDAYTTAAGDTLGTLATRFWGLAADEGQGRAEFIRACRVILRRNEAVLGPVLNPDKDPKWDFLVARADQRKLPGGLRVEFARYLPPPHWVGGEVPEHARKQPMHFLSWEQADDFCAWAGFHLPTEFEWERAARGPEGRLLPWEGEWDPLKAVWHGFNGEARKKKRLDITVRPSGVPPEDAPSATPFPADVDTFPEGATKEGIHHLIGNVAEITSSRAWKYDKSATRWQFSDGSPIVVRGGSWEEQDEEFLLATDRAANSFLGARLASHVADSAGFRLASYPVAGADLTLRIAERFDPRRAVSPFISALPVAPGIDEKERRSDDPWRGFAVQRTAGLLTRQLAPESADHVWVTGPATGIAFLPVNGFPASAIKAPSDLVKIAGNPERLVVLGILTGTRNAGIDLLAPPAPAADGAAPGAETKKSFEFDDIAAFGVPQAFRDQSPADERVLTEERIGAVVTFDGTHVHLWQLNDSLRGPAKYRAGLLGRLEAAPLIEKDAKKDGTAPFGKLDGGLAELSTSIPMLDVKGRSSGAVRVTIWVPFHAQGGGTGSLSSK